MEKGALLGKGMTAEVFKWGSDKVLKLFFERYGEERILYEAKIGDIVHQAVEPSPAVFDVIDVDGRKGILFQRVNGKTMSKQIEAKPWKLYCFAKQLAGLHFKIHECSAELLPSQKERLTFVIGRSSQRLGDKGKRILEYLESLPDGFSVCHGDLHFNNVIVSGKALVAVDWNSAYRGNPLGDVARTCLMMNSPVVNPGTPTEMVRLIQYIKWLTYLTYINEYMRLSKVKLESIEEWILPIAAAKLKDNPAKEEEWLMDIINKRLLQL